MSEYEYVMEDDGPLGKNADVVGPILLAIEKRDGSVTAEALAVEAKRLSRDHPLRRYIWGASDQEAAMRYRIDRAACVIRSIKVVLRREGHEPVTSRLMYRGAERRTFNNVHTVMSSAELRDKTLGQAAEDAEDYKQRYRFLRECSEIISAIDEFIPKARKKMAKK